LGIRERAMVMLVASTGVRHSERIGFKWTDIDEGTMEITPDSHNWSAKPRDERSDHLLVNLSFNAAVKTLHLYIGKPIHASVQSRTLPHRQ
jgi:integrase